MDLLDLIDGESNSKNKNHSQYDDKYIKKYKKSEYGDIDGNTILGKFGQYKKFLPAMIIIGIFLILAIIGLVIYFFPYLTSLINNVEQNGINGVIESGSGLLNGILHGNGG